MDDEKTPLSSAQVAETVRSVRDRLVALAATDFDALPDSERLALAAALNHITRKAEEVQLALVREVCARGLHTTEGYESPEAYLSDRLHITMSEAAARVRAAYRV